MTSCLPFPPSPIPSTLPLPSYPLPTSSYPPPSLSYPPSTILLLSPNCPPLPTLHSLPLPSSYPPPSTPPITTRKKITNWLHGNYGPENLFKFTCSPMSRDHPTIQISRLRILSRRGKQASESKEERRGDLK